MNQYTPFYLLLPLNLDIEWETKIFIGTKIMEVLDAYLGLPNRENKKKKSPRKEIYFI